MPCLDKRLYMPLDRIATGPRNLNGVGDAHAAPFTGDVQDPDREFREVSQDEPLVIDPLSEAILLLAQGREEVDEPGFPVGRLGSESALGLP